MLNQLFDLPALPSEATTRLAIEIYLANHPTHQLEDLVSFVHEGNGHWTLRALFVHADGKTYTEARLPLVD